MKLLSAPIHKYCEVFEVKYPPTRPVGLESSKSEARNLKQIQKANAQNTITTQNGAKRDGY
jgi:hypothetical protein